MEKNVVPKRHPKRIAMYVIYDKDGILDNFRKYYLKELRKVVDCIVGVVSGTLTPESRDELSEFTDDFFVRENKGLLAGSWLFRSILSPRRNDGCCRKIRCRFLRCHAEF